MKGVANSRQGMAMDQSHENFLLPFRQGRRVLLLRQDAVKEAPGFAFTEVALAGSYGMQTFKQFGIKVSLHKYPSAPSCINSVTYSCSLYIVRTRTFTS